MQRDRTRRKLSIRSETLRRLSADRLARVAGGVIGERCTYEQTGCGPAETALCGTMYCETGQCTGNCGTDDNGG